MMTMFFLAAIPALVGMMLVNAEGRLPRTGYALRIVCTLIACLILGYLNNAIFFGAIPLAALTVLMIANFLLGRWVTLRIQDIGWNRNIRFIFLVPYLGYLLLIAALIPSTDSEVTGVQETVS